MDLNSPLATILFTFNKIPRLLSEQSYSSAASAYVSLTHVPPASPQAQFNNAAAAQLVGSISPQTPPSSASSTRLIEAISDEDSISRISTSSEVALSSVYSSLSLTKTPSCYLLNLEKYK